MATDKLFGNKIAPQCRYCTHAYKQIGKKNYLCDKNGTVFASFSCRHFQYDPLKRIPNPPLALQKFTKEDFYI